MILLFLERDAGEIARTSLEALAFARTLSEPIHAVTFGEDGDYAPAAWAQALADSVSTTSASAVIAAGTDRGNELLARLGAKMPAPFAANCVAATRGDDGMAVTRQRWGGSLLEDAVIRAPVTLLSVALHTVAPASADDAASVPIEELVPSSSPEDLRVRATRVEAADDGAVSLGDARLVIGGGRGVGSADGFSVLDGLAATLGATVGVSRAVTSAGWRPHTEQIGQTGERIAPELYIACGISGASQHMVGCRGAKKLLAINSDPDAPILAKSDYAVIGDLHQVVPAIGAEIARRRG